jgi:L-serine/L-threonine ammonia-lyase
VTLHIVTPLLRSQVLSDVAGCSIWLKCEALQPAGSFKLRGIGHACEQFKKEGAQRFISSSGGNAGIAVAYAGRMLSIPVTVVVPETTSERAKQLIQSEQARVVVHGASWQEAHEFALSLAGANDAFLHPFDHPLLWTGHASLVDEVVKAGLQPDAVVLSVGGGGLLAGVAEGLKRNSLQQVPIFAVETEGAASFHAAMQAGKGVELEKISSVATSLGAKRVSDRALELSKDHAITSLLVSDRDAVAASVAFMNDHRLVVEPACGAALAIAYQARPELSAYKNVLMVVCGGVTATVEQLLAWQQQFSA